MDKVMFGFDTFIVAPAPKTMEQAIAEVYSLPEAPATTITRASFIYEVRDLMKEHNLTLEQVMYLLASIHGIDWELTGADALSLISKGLLMKGNQVNQTVLFRTRPPIQTELELNFETKPRGTDETLKLAHNIETKLVPASHQTDEFRKSIADEYFKGDLTAARYFIIFRHLFPVRDIKSNILWNKHFGLTYGGITLWDSHVRVAKKFYEIYRKKDIGLFLAGTYHCVQDSINAEEERCFMTKPYKFLLAYEPWYNVAKERLEERHKEAQQQAELQASNDANKTQSL